MHARGRGQFTICMTVLALTFWAPPVSQADSGTVRVRALIDGTSTFVVRGSEIWWQHYSDAAPGLHSGASAPTARLVDISQEIVPM